MLSERYKISYIGISNSNSLKVYYNICEFQAEVNQTAKRSVTSHDISQVSETILCYHHIIPHSLLTSLQFVAEMGSIYNIRYISAGKIHP